MPVNRRMPVERGPAYRPAWQRDYARKVILKGYASKETLVREIMSSHVLYVRPEQAIEDWWR